MGNSTQASGIVAASVKSLSHACELCGDTFHESELNCDDKLVLGSSGAWKTETRYRCYDCAKKAVFG